jgi:hypothetical protein
MTEVGIDANPRPNEAKELKQLRCSKCGVTVDAACNCGVGYVPASEYAAKAVADNPGKSNYVIAGETGLSESTVRRARPDASKDVTARRTGRDGKSYPSRRKSKTTTQPKPEAQPLDKALSALTQIEQLTDDLGKAIGGNARSDIVDSRIRAVVDRLLVLIPAQNQKYN